ncbi:MAG TPA: MltA domain-containing protein [Geminicoccaceae bacterium]|nr:MltA domain-containing protein [Geminicoccaceae bacterium]
MARPRRLGPPPAAVGGAARVLLPLALLLAGCGTEPPEPPPEPRFELVPAAFGDLDGWAEDDPSPAVQAFARSCQPWLRRDDGADAGRSPVAGRVGDWRPACEAARLFDGGDALAARRFFERWFAPYRVTYGDRTGLFTGYFEPRLYGSRRPGGPYTVPLHRRPPDLVQVDLGLFDPELAGKRIAGRVDGGQLRPYSSNGDIAEGALAGRNLELVWVSDPIDKFFLQIQGSGQVVLDDGSTIRVGYAAQNGHRYRAIGRDLIEMGEIPKEQVSLQSIRDWLRAHPEAASDLMARNPSYVFFTEVNGLDPEAGPLGSLGVPLTAGRSLAVDPAYIPLGAPVWLDTTAPAGDGREVPLRRLVIAQDTGGAIKGPIRGDVFWGAGDVAGEIAGRMKSEGGYVLLLPKSLTPTS